MPRGGARVNSGPPPDPNALRRDRPSDKEGWITIPATYDGDIPDWPLDLRAIVKGGPEMAAAVAFQEIEIWRRMWRTPQANVWATNPGTVLEVALYCRQMALAATGRAMDAAEARQWSDRLGLNPAAMMRMRWKVEGDQAATVQPTPRERRSDAVAARPSARERLRGLESA